MNGLARVHTCCCHGSSVQLGRGLTKALALVPGDVVLVVAKGTTSRVELRYLAWSKRLLFAPGAGVDPDVFENVHAITLRKAPASDVTAEPPKPQAQQFELAVTEQEPWPQRNHVDERQLGGKRVHLVVLNPRPTPPGFAFVIEPGRTPATRGDCPPVSADGKRWCPYVRCRHHQWRDDGVERPGRRWAGRVHNSKNVINMRAEQCCALDVLDAANGIPMPHDAIGEALAVTGRQVRRVAKRALEKMASVDGADTLLEEMVNR